MKYEKPYLELMEVEEDIVTGSNDDGLFDTGNESNDDSGDYEEIFN